MRAPGGLVAAAFAVTAGACARAPEPAVPSPAGTAIIAGQDTARAAQSGPPAPGPVPPLSLPPIAERVLPNGLRVLVVEHHELPVVTAVLVVRTGHEADPSDGPGLASLTAALLDEGAGTRSALDIGNQLAALGAKLGTAAGWDASTVTVQTSAAGLDSTLALVADIAIRPAFRPADVDRLRAERVTHLAQVHARASSAADLAFVESLYGDAHPYGRSPLGTERAVRSFTRTRFQRFHARYYRPGNATLVVVGDVAPATLFAAAEREFGGWVRGDGPVPHVVPPPPPSVASRAVHVVDRPGVTQSSVRIGLVGVARSSADHVPLVVMNTVLGVPFGSRLNRTLREQKGYTYGVKSWFDARAGAGPFMVRTEVLAERSDSAVFYTLRELERMRDTVSMEELERAKRWLQARLPADFETPTGIAMQVATLATYELPLDWFNRYAERVAAVTQADVQRVARTYLDPARMTIVVAGDAKRIGSGLKSVGVAGRR